MSTLENPLSSRDVFVDLLRSLNGQEDGTRFIAEPGSVRDAISSFVLRDGVFTPDEDFYYVTLEPNSRYEVFQALQTGNDSLDLDLIIGSYTAPFTQRQLDDFADDTRGLRPLLSFETGPFRQTLLFQVDTFLNANVGIGGNSAGAPRVEAQSGNTLIGSDVAETFNGGAGNDTILANGGDDTANGQGGDDSIDGGTGNDLLSGNSGNDRIDGGAGDDEIFGGDGDDQIAGGLGFDELTGGLGADTFYVVDGDEIVDFNAMEGDVIVERIDIPEPDIPGNATTTETIAPDETRTSEISSPMDEDWFETTLIADVDYTFELEDAATLVSTLTPQIIIYDAQSREVARSVAQLGETTIDFTPTTGGTYFISATATMGMGSYSLRMIAGEGGGGTPEEGGTDGVAFPFLSIVEAFGYDAANDQMLVNVTFDKNRTSSAFEEFGIPGYDAEVSDFPMSQVFNIDPLTASAAGLSLDELPPSAFATTPEKFLALSAKAGAQLGDYAAAVGLAPEVGTSNIDFGFGGDEGLLANPPEYTLSVAQVEAPDETAGADVVGDTLANALLLPESATFHGTINETGDADVYAVFLTQGETADFSLRRLGDNANLRLETLSPSGAVMGTANAGGAPGAVASLSITASQTEFFFVRVTDTGSGNPFGTYELVYDDPDGTPPTFIGNRQPDAASGTAEVEIGATVTIDVLDGASDADGDTLSVFALDTDGTEGTVSISNGQVLYDPGAAFDDLAPGESRVDLFRYALTDGSDGASSAAVVVTVTAPDDGGGEQPQIGTDGDDRFVYTTDLEQTSFDGLTGTDSISLPFALADPGLEIAPIEGGFEVRPDGEDAVTLLSVERLEFTDGTLEADFTEVAASALRYYVGGLGRLPDLAGITFWVNAIQSGDFDLDRFARAILVSDEFNARFPPDSTNAEFIDDIYENVYNREIDQAGFDFWLEELEMRDIPRFRMVRAFADAEEARTIYENETDDGVLLLV